MVAVLPSRCTLISLFLVFSTPLNPRWPCTRRWTLSHLTTEDVGRRSPFGAAPRPSTSWDSSSSVRMSSWWYVARTGRLHRSETPHRCGPAGNRHASRGTVTVAELEEDRGPRMAQSRHRVDRQVVAARRRRLHRSRELGCRSACQACRSTRRCRSPVAGTKSGTCPRGSSSRSTPHRCGARRAWLGRTEAAVRCGARPDRVDGTRDRRRFCADGSDPAAGDHVDGAVRVAGDVPRWRGAAPDSQAVIAVILAWFAEMRDDGRLVAIGRVAVDDRWAASARSMSTRDGGDVALPPQ